MQKQDNNWFCGIRDSLQWDKGDCASFVSISSILSFYDSNYPDPYKPISRSPSIAVGCSENWCLTVCHGVEIFTLADWPRIKCVVKSKSSDVRVSSDSLDLGHFANLGHLERISALVALQGTNFRSYVISSIAALFINLRSKLCLPNHNPKGHLA